MPTMTPCAPPRTRPLLRITAVLFLVYALGHTVGGMLHDTGRGPRQAALFEAMREFTFPVQGVTRSYWDFYRGFGLAFSVTLVLLAALSWIVGDLSRTYPGATRPLACALFLGMVPLTALAWIDFFPAPGIFSTAVTVLLGVVALAPARA